MQIKRLINHSARVLLFTVFAYFSVALNAQAETVVSGAITSNTTWLLDQSSYHVTADVTVENGAVLTIEAGVVVYFDADTNLTISNGALVAVGTVSAPITFTSILDTAEGSAGDWGQVRFLDATNDSATILAYANIRYGHGLMVQSASPTFNYLNITNNQGAAISIDLSSSPKGEGNQAANNTINGISVPAGDVLGNVTWGVKGIPYIVTTGTVAVGAAPTITSVTPSEVQQGFFVESVITGTRLAGVNQIKFDDEAVSATLTGPGNGIELPVTITATEAATVGANIPFEVRTSAGWTRYETGINIIALRPIIALIDITPDSMRRDETKSFQVNGTSLEGAQVNTPAGLTLSNLQTTATQVTFDLTASTSATLGTQFISAFNPVIANGTATIELTIVDALPKVDINTIPAAVLPDAEAHQFDIALTNTDSVDHILNFSMLDDSIITVSPASVTIPAGETVATINITGLVLGSTTLSITSPTLASVSKHILSSNLTDGAVIDPLLSSVINIQVAVPAGSNLLTTSPLITVNVPIINAEMPVLSYLITVHTAAPTESVPVLSPVIAVEVPDNADEGF